MIIYAFIMTVLVVGLMIMIYLKNKSLDSFKVQLKASRADTAHWNSKVHELEMANYLKMEPNFKGTGHVPKDYDEEEQQI